MKTARKPRRSKLVFDTEMDLSLAEHPSRQLDRLTRSFRLIGTVKRRPAVKRPSPNRGTIEAVGGSVVDAAFSERIPSLFRVLRAGALRGKDSARSRAAPILNGRRGTIRQRLVSSGCCCFRCPHCLPNRTPLLR